MSFGGSFFGAPRSKLKNLEVDVATLVADAVNDRIGVGDSAPGTQLQIKGEQPYVTLQNSTAENSDGGCETKIIFEDHANVSLGQIEVNHSGSADDTKGKMVLSTHTGSSLTAAITINEAQKVTAAGDVQVTGDIILDDGGSLKEAGGTAAITFDGSGNVTKIGQDSPSTNEVLTYDGAKWVASASSTDLNALSAAVVDVAADSIGIIDANDSNNSKKESIADLMTAVAGSQATTGLTASSGTLVVTDLHPVGVSGSANQIITDDGDGTVTSEAKAKVDGATMTIGNGTAEDASVQFDGNTVDFYVGVDDSQDALVLGVGTALGTNVGLGINGNGQVQAFDAFGASTGGTFGTFGSSDTTPSVATGNLWKTHASEQTLTDFLDGLAGQIIVVLSTAAVTFDVTSSGLKGGSTDIVTASGDVTVWAYDGTDWNLVQFMDVSADMSSVGGGGGGMSNFVLEDGDGTEVTIGDGKEVKFVEGGGIDINWTDTDNGTDGDPYDLTFTVSSTGVSSAMVTDGVRGTADQLGEVLFNQVFS